jgi:hypothetical protein
MKKMKKNKKTYHVHEYMGGYFGICHSNWGGGCVFGGDSACEDHYNKGYVEEVFEQWDGILLDGRIDASVFEPVI